MLFGHHAAAGDSCSSPPRSAREKELEALLRSGVARDHTQLHNLLVYLGNKSLDENPEPLKEYTIGVEALHKPATYDPRLDPTVRVEVGRLRKKLQEFYQGPGAGHDVQLLIPKGGYLPVYAAGTGLGRAAVGRRAGLLIAAAVLGTIVLTAVGWIERTAAQPSLAAELQAFWAPHLVKDTPTILVYGTPLFTKLDGSFFRDPRVNTTEEAAASGRLARVTEAMTPGEIRPVFGFTGAGEAEALFLLTRLLASHATLVAHASSRLTWDDLKGKHAILLGGRKYNPLIPELPYKPRFEAVRRAIFELGAAGTPVRAFQTASKTPHGEITEEYALVSVYPGLSPGTRLVILDGSSSEGTLAAAEFLTRTDTLRELAGYKLPLVRAGEAVRPFQVVIGAKINRGVVVSVFYVTHALLS